MNATVSGGTPTMLCAVWALNRQVLIQGLKQWTEERVEEHPSALGGLVYGAPFLRVELAECGSGITYSTEVDVPEESVPCPCGNPTHWLIKYG